MINLLKVDITPQKRLRTVRNEPEETDNVCSSETHSFAPKAAQNSMGKWVFILNDVGNNDEGKK